MKILGLYRSKVSDYIKRHGRYLSINIELTNGFLKTCEERIVAGHKKYGDDWKTKDNLAERDQEVYDYFNYTILDACQKNINIPIDK